MKCVLALLAVGVLNAGTIVEATGSCTVTRVATGEVVLHETRGLSDTNVLNCSSVSPNVYAHIGLEASAYAIESGLYANVSYWLYTINEEYGEDLDPMVRQ